MNALPTRALIAAAFLVPTAVVSSLAATREFRTKVVVAEKTLPEKIGTWTGELIPLTEGEKSMLGSPAASQRLYSDAAGDQVQVLLLQVNDTQNAHDPKLCMAGSGYALGDERTLPCPWADPKDTFQVSRAEFSKEQSRVTMYYWLQTPQGSVADMSSGFKLEGVKRALMGSTVRGVAIRVIALPNARDAQQPTDPRAAEALWRTVSDQIKLKGLIAQM